MARWGCCRGGVLGIPPSGCLSASWSDRCRRLRPARRATPEGRDPTWTFPQASDPDHRCGVRIRRRWSSMLAAERLRDLLATDPPRWARVRGVRGCCQGGRWWDLQAVWRAGVLGNLFGEVAGGCGRLAGFVLPEPSGRQPSHCAPSRPRAFDLSGYAGCQRGDRMQGFDYGDRPSTLGRRWVKCEFIVDVSVAERFSCGLRTDGSAQCWGDNAGDGCRGARAPTTCQTAR